MVISESCCTFIVLNYKVVQTILAMFTEDKVTEIFFMTNEFHKVFCRMLDKYSLNGPKWQERGLTKEQYERGSDECLGQSAAA